MKVKNFPTQFVSIPEEFFSKKISILMPFLNEEKNIVKNVRIVKDYVENLKLNFEIILVDDGSIDNSYSLLLEAYSNEKNIKVIKNLRNFGKGWALKTAYEFSEGDLILFLDSDLELSIEHLPCFLKIMNEEKADAVIGSKLHEDSIVNYPWYRRILSIGYYSIVKLLFGLPIMDTQTGIKLFKKEALEISLPKVLVKKFAFDIELLLILFKKHKKIVSAPIKLEFSRNFGWNLKFNVVFHTFLDTLAVWYRDKILKFYDRPFGINKKYFYSIVLFSNKNDEFEKLAFESFMSILYPYYEVILAGEERFESKKDYKFVKINNKLTDLEKLNVIINSIQLMGDIIVFSKLDSLVDERFLFNAGRILSLENVGGVGGYLFPHNSLKFFEFSHRILGSFFLNFNLAYRYKPVNFKKVKELNLNGLFVKKELLFPFDLKKYKRIETFISEKIKEKGKDLFYSPDIMLYYKFPSNLKELFIYTAKNAFSRGYELRELILNKRLSSLSIGYFIPFIFILCFLYSIMFMKSALFVFYGFIFLTRFIYGFKAIFDVFFIAIFQIYYAVCYIVGIFQK